MKRLLILALFMMGLFGALMVTSQSSQAQERVPSAATKWHAEWQNPLPTGMSLYDIWEVDGKIFAVGGVGTLLQYQGDEWVSVDLGASESFRGMWGAEDGELFVVGYESIWHYDENGWRSMDNGLEPDIFGLYSVWGFDSNDVYAVGGDNITHYDGETWTAIDIEVSRLTDVWGSSPHDLYVVGAGGTAMHYDGESWTPISLPNPTSFNSVWGSSATDVFVAGATGIIYHYDGTSWEYTDVSEARLYHIWGTSGDNVYAVGENGIVLHYDGTEWTSLENPLWGGYSLRSLWHRNHDDIFFVGTNGIILHYDGVEWERQGNGLTGPYVTITDIWGSDKDNIFATMILGAGSQYDNMQYDGHSWEVASVFTNTALLDLWGTSATDVFAVSRNEVWHYDGVEWSAQVSDLPFNPWFIEGFSPNDVFAIGPNGAMAHYDGVEWSVVESGTPDFIFNGVWGDSGTDIFAVGDFKGGGYSLFHYNGSEWQIMVNTGIEMSDLWGTSPTNIYAVGQDSTILHYDGTTWTEQTVTDEVGMFRRIEGTSHENIFAVGDYGLAMHYDGTSWQEMPHLTYIGFNDVWAVGNEAWVVGAYGTILHYWQTNQDVFLPFSVVTAGN